MKAQKSKRETNSTYYCAEAVIAIWVLGVIGYCIYQSKTPKDKPRETSVHRPKETSNKFNMDSVIKMDKKSI